MLIVMVLCRGYPRHNALPTTFCPWRRGYLSFLLTEWIVHWWGEWTADGLAERVEDDQGG